MRTIIILISIFVISLTAFSQDCPDNTELSVVKNKYIDVQDFDYTVAYGNYNSTWKTYRAIFINYPKSEDSDFKAMSEGQIKVVVMVFNSDGNFPGPGVYTLKGGETNNKFAVSIQTVEGSTYGTSINGQDIGNVSIIKSDENILCGEVNIHDSDGMEVVGTFTVSNEDVK